MKACNGKEFKINAEVLIFLCIIILFSTLFTGYRDKTFLEYLNTKNLTPIVKHYVMQAIAMATDKTSCRDGVNRTKHFLNSLGRYGNTPFLWPMYGSGELPQCFCRWLSIFSLLTNLPINLSSLLNFLFIFIRGHL